MPAVFLQNLHIQYLLIQTSNTSNTLKGLTDFFIQIPLNSEGWALYNSKQYTYWFHGTIWMTPNKLWVINHSPFILQGYDHVNVHQLSNQQNYFDISNMGFIPDLFTHSKLAVWNNMIWYKFNAKNMTLLVADLNWIIFHGAPSLFARNWVTIHGHFSS